MATVTISLPNEIAKRVDSEAKKRGFATRSEFVRSLLRGYFSREEVRFEEFAPQPIEKIKLELAKTGKYSQEFIESVTQGLTRSSLYES